MTKQMEIVNGAELISRGAMDAGVNFFAGYPITPASSVYTAMLNKLQAEGKIALGVSDEISAACMCLGAAMRGAKTMSATAAPGLFLMSETINYGFMTETPFLLVIGQRMGPSVGAATQTAESDISYVCNLIAGGYKIPVIAPNSILNCYETTIKAINISEKYRTPVILLTEKDVIMSTSNINPDDLPEVEVINRKKFQADGSKVFQSYGFDRLNEVPDFVAAGFGVERVVITGSVHDKEGRLSKTQPEALEVIEHLKAKIDDNVEEMSFVEKDYDDGAEVAVISFLLTDQAARKAIIDARAKGVKVKHLTLFTLCPVPEHEILDAIKGTKHVIVPEENHSGQYADIIKHLFKDQELTKVNKLGGLIAPSRIEEAIMNAAGAVPA